MSVSEPPHYTAKKLMLGREVNTQAHVMFPQAGRKKDSLDGYVAEFVSSVQKAHEVARTKLKTATKRMKRNYDLRILERTFA